MAALFVFENNELHVFFMLMLQFVTPMFQTVAKSEL